MFSRLIFAWVLVIGALFCRAQELPLTHYTPRSEQISLPSADVIKIYQDKMGYLWLGVYSSGLIRYDGLEMETFGPESGLSDRYVVEMVEDEDGRLWVGCDGGLAVSSKPLDEYGLDEDVRFIQTFSGMPLMANVENDGLVKDSERGIWCVDSADGVFHFEWKDGVVDRRKVPLPEGFDQLTVRSLHSFRDGSLWLSCNQGLFRLAPGASRFEPALPQEHQPKAVVNVFFEDLSGRIWVGCTDGSIWRFRNWGVGPPRFELIDEGIGEQITVFLEEKTGRFWVGSYGGGLLTFHPSKPGERKVYGPQNGFLTKSFRDIFLDREGNLWFCQTGGLSKLRANYEAHLHFTANAGFGVEPVLAAPGVQGTLPRAGSSLEDRIWVATEGGGVAVIDDAGQAVTLNSKQGLVSDNTMSLLKDHRRRIWIGSLNGLNIFCRDQEALPRGLRTDLRAVSLDGVSGWLASYSGGASYLLKETGEGGPDTSPMQWRLGNGILWVLVENHWILLGRDAGVPATRLQGFGYDDLGRVWLGSRDRGLYRSPLKITSDRLLEIAEPSENGDYLVVRKGLFQQVWDVSSGAPNNNVRSLVWQKGEMWAGLANGLAKLANEPPELATFLNSEDGLGADNVTSMAMAPGGRKLWLGTNGGLSEVSPETGLVVRTISKDDGLVDNEIWYFSSLSVGQDGRVYYGSARGLSVYDPEKDVRQNIPPPVHLKRFKVRQRADGTNELKARIAAPTFTNEQQTRIQYYLDGYDEGWRAPTRSADIYYTNLPAYFFSRTYELHVRAGLEENLESSKVLVHQFQIQPPWWFRWWAFLLFILVACFMAWSFFRMRTAKLNRRTRILEAKVDARTRELSLRNEELERLDRIVKTINREIDFDSVLRALLEQGLKLFPEAGKGAFLVRDPKVSGFVIAAAVGYDLDALKDMRTSEDEVAARYLDENRKIDDGLYWVQQRQTMTTQGLPESLTSPRGAMAVALRLSGDLAGVIVWDNLRYNRNPDPALLNKMARFREHAVSAFHKAHYLRELHEKNKEILLTQNQMVVREKMASLGTLTAGIAHELRNPLNFIKNMGELSMELLRDLKDAVAAIHPDLEENETFDEVRELLEDMARNSEILNEHGKRAEVIVASMMEFAGGPAKAQVALIESILEDYTSLAVKGFGGKADRIRIAFAFDARKNTIYCVPRDLSRVVVSVVKNAVESILEKVEKEEGFQGEIHISTQDRGEYLEFVIRDNGMGMDEETIEKAVNPFFTTKPTGRGNIGLGLSIAYDIVVRGHLGHFSFESQKDQYTACIVQLPRDGKVRPRGDVQDEARA